MGRFSTTFRRPPVRIGAAQAAVQQELMLRGATRTADGAGGFGARETAKNASVPMQLRIDSSTGPTRGRALPLGHTHRKRGYPPLPVTTAKLGGE